MGNAITARLVSVDETSSIQINREALQRLLRKSLITETGIDLIAADPNLSEKTVIKLVNTDKEYLSKEMRATIATGKGIAIASNEMLLGNSATGYACLKSCIMEDLDQTMAELVARFVQNKSNIPYVYAAILLRNFQKRKGFEYTRKFRDFGSGHPIKWAPRTVPVVNFEEIETCAAERVLPPI